MKRTKTPFDKKKYSISDLLVAVSKWKNQGLNICFTNGCFDILHLGHVSYLSRAAELADILIVGVNSDRSVKALEKAPNRPVNNERQRALIVASLGSVDAVIVFDEDTPLELISKIMPNVLVKGGDYDPLQETSDHPKYIVGRKEVIDNGGEVKTIELIEGFSTTGIINKMGG